jgi:hypothetical protein
VLRRDDALEEELLADMNTDLHRCGSPHKHACSASVFLAPSSSAQHLAAHPALLRAGLLNAAPCMVMVAEG